MINRPLPQAVLTKTDGAGVGFPTGERLGNSFAGSAISMGERFQFAWGSFHCKTWFRCYSVN